MTLSSSILRKSLLWWIPFLLLLPFTLTILSVLSIYKGTVFFLSKLLRGHDLIRPVTGLDISFSTDDFYGRPFGGLSFIWIVDDFLSPDLVIDRFRTGIASRKHDYEKLTSVFPTFWLGYPFWQKAEREFDIRNHVKVMKVNKEIAINKQICDWMMEPFIQGVPLWEVRLVPSITLSKEDNVGLFGASSKTDHEIRTKISREETEKYDKVKSILILKVHHIVGDGYSMLGLLDKIVDSSRNGERPYLEKATLQTKPSQVWEHRVEKIRGQKQNEKRTADRLEERFPFQSESNKSSHFRRLQVIFRIAAESCAYATTKILSQLSNIVLLTFLTPYTFFALVYDFGFHRDSWFTHKKNSTQVNLGTARVLIKRVNEIRRDLFNFSQSHRRCDVGFKENKNAKPGHIPIIVIAVSALAGALRRLFTDTLAGKKASKISDAVNKQSGTGKGTWGPASRELEIPHCTNFMVALPLPEKHHGSSKFCNFWTHGILHVGMKEEDSLSRVLLLNNFYNEIHGRRSPEIYHLLVKFHSLLPQPILRVISMHNMGAPIGVTNMLGSPDCLFIDGKRVLHQYAFVGLLWRHASMTLGMISYNGEMTATVVANESVISGQDKVETLLRNGYLEELEQLSHLTKKKAFITNDDNMYVRRGKSKIDG